MKEAFGDVHGIFKDDLMKCQNEQGLVHLNLLSKMVEMDIQGWVWKSSKDLMQGLMKTMGVFHI